MKLSNVAGLYAMRLRAQLGQELLALIGIAVGVSLLFAALVANTSLTGSFERMTHGIVGKASFQLTSRGVGFPESTVSAVQRLPGVDHAAGILEARAEIRASRQRRSVLLIGVTPDFAQLGGSLTTGISHSWLGGVRALALPTPIVRTLGLQLGASLVLNVNGREVPARLGAKLQSSDVGALVDSPVAIAPLSYAQELTGRPATVSRIFVRPRPDRTDAVERALQQLGGQRADVRPADFDTALFRQASTPTSQSTAMFSVFSAMVGFLFAYSAVLLTVPQRRRLIADLRVEGYGPGTVLQVLLFEALALGVVASAIGVVAGDQIARRLFDDRPAFLDMAFTFSTERITTPGTVLVAAAGGIVASLVAVLAPMGPSLIADADEAGMAAARPGSRRAGLAGIVAGLTLLATGALVAVVKPRSAVVGIVGLALLTAAMLLLLPMLLRLFVTTIDVATRSTRSIVPFLAITDLRDPATRLRSLAVAATGAVAVLGSVALQGAHADLQRGLDRTAHDLATIGDVWVVAPGPANLLATTPFSRPHLGVPRGIASIADYRASFLDIGSRRVWVLGSPVAARHPLARGQMLDGTTAEATRLLRSGGWAVVSEALARDLRLHVGDRFLLPSPLPVKLRVSGLSTNLGWPPGAIVISADDYARAWGSGDVSALSARLAPGTSPAEGRSLLRHALGPHTGLVVKTAADREHAFDAGSRQGLARLTQIAAMVLAGAMIAMAAAMAGMIWQRRAFLASMKVEGYSTWELWRSLLLEAAILVGAGCVIGAAFGLLGQTLLSRALTTVTGFPVDYSPAALGALLTCTAVTVVAVAIIALFGHRAARISAERGFH